MTILESDLQGVVSESIEYRIIKQDVCCFHEKTGAYT